jgi:hypothetical protein
LLVLGLLGAAVMVVPSGALGSSPTVVATTAVSASGSTTVQLNGTVDTSSCGSSFVEWTFEFGSEQDLNYHYDLGSTDQMTGAPGSMTGIAPNNPFGFAKSDTANQAVSTTIPQSGSPALMSGVVYHWRLAAFVSGSGGSCAGGWTVSNSACFELGQGAVPCPAQGSETFTVVNRRGILQEAVVSYAPAGASGYDQSLTSPGGTVTLTVEAGEVLRFSRSPHISGSCSAPEGTWYQGVVYTVPANPPSQATITLDNTTTSDAPATPMLSSAERWVIGKINDMRQARSLSRLQVSTTLDRVAYATAADAAALKAANGSYPWPPKYCAAVGDDWGWPQLSLDTRGFGGNDAATTSPAAALAHWTDSSARGKLTFSSGATAIGIGDGGTAWTMFVSDCSNVAVAVAARCQMTSDTGDSSIQLPPSTGGSGSGGTPTSPAAAAQSLAGRLATALTGLTAGGLLKAGGVTVTFTSGGKGHASVGCVAPVHRRRVTFAKGVAPTWKVTVRLRVTPAGRLLLKTAEHSHRTLHASCTATFYPASGAPVTKTRKLTLAS